MRLSRLWGGIVPFLVSRSLGSLGIFIGLWLLSSTLEAATYPALEGKKGIVATDHPLASEAGAAILRQGGNAIDAACAAAFALGVVNPAGSGIGGGGFLMLKIPRESEPIILDFRETAPKRATAGLFQTPGLPNDASRFGGLAVAIPGEVRGCSEAIRRYGRLHLAQVLSPAIRLARDGFPVGRHLATSLQSFGPRLALWKELHKEFAPDGKLPVVGQILRRPRLAKALQAIATEGPDAFYKGWIARDIVQTIQKAGGIVTLEDLATYTVRQRKPLATEFLGHKVFLMPPPSSGGIVLAQSLRFLQALPLLLFGHNSSATLHHLAEILKHTFADRSRYLGDTDFVEIPLLRLLSADTLESYRKRITPGQTQDWKTYGTPALPPKAPLKDKGTTHISAIDAEGFAAALTTTVNTSFGSLLVTEASGIVLNNEMDDFSTTPGKPNAFGLLQSDKNSIAPGKRPLSSMSPTLILKDGRPVLAVGGSGGPTIITGVLQVILNVLAFRLEVADAVSRSRIHHQWFPPLLFVETDLPHDVLDALKKRGHAIRAVPSPFTAVQAVHVRDGKILGASDPRKYGRPAGD